MAKNKKIIRFRRPMMMNVGIIVFLVFFFYLVFNVFNHMTKESVQIYEVGEAAAAVNDNSYTGLILREETVYETPKAGYINYYIREGSRASVGDTIYSIDENGEYTRLLQSSGEGESSLNSEQLDSLKTKLTSFTASYRPENFHHVYQLKYTLQNQLLSYLSSSSLEELKELGINTNYLSTQEADQSGTVVYNMDGLETVKEEDLTADDFNPDNHPMTSVGTGSLLEKNAFIYKTITSEEWNIYVLLNEEDQAALSEISSIKVHFNDINLDVNADFTLIQTKDGQIMGKCTLYSYMVQLADRRYTSVTLEKSSNRKINTNGLKVPKTAIVEKDFKVIPKEYATRGGNDSQIGFIRETYTATGVKAEFITPEIYSEDDNYYYIASESLDNGTLIMKPAMSLMELEAQQISEESAAAAKESSQGTEESGEISQTDESATEISSEEEASEETEESTESEDSDSESSEESTETDDQESTYTSEAVDGAPQASESSSPFTIGETKPLKGVFSVNKGYTVFKQVRILNETDDYYVVKAGQSYGLAVYDHILLDGSKFKEGDMIYQ